MAPRIFLHIGVHKTGSTAIQHYLYRNRAALLRAGVLYPDAGRPSLNGVQQGHHNLSWELSGRMPVKGALAEFGEAIGRSDAECVIASSEEFDRLTRDQIVRLSSCLPAGTKVVFYYRRQSDVLQGNYGTDIVYNRVTTPIEQYATDSDSVLDYFELASRWGDVFGRENLIIRPYLRSRFPGGDIVADFLACIGLAQIRLEGSAGERADKDPSDLAGRNPSLPWHSAYTVQHMWQLDMPVSLVMRTIRMLHIVNGDRVNPYEFFSPSAACEFDSRFAESNRRFRDEFCPDQDLIEPRRLESDEAWRERRKAAYAGVIKTISAVAEYVELTNRK